MAANPASAEPAATAPADRPVTNWHVRTPEGPIYGPIGWDEVLAWAAEGRIAADCELAESGQGPWRSAVELIPHLPPSNTQPVAGPAAPTAYPWTPALAGPVGSAYAPAGGGYVAPHRGGLVLVLGLLGLFSCPVFSFIAWIMGSHDLREMRSGRMDRSGESLTMAGMILGMILSLLWMVAAIGLLGLIVIAIAARL